MGKIIAFANQNEEIANVNSSATITLQDAIIKGLKSEAKDLARLLVSNIPPLEIINNHIIPALDIVGEKYENPCIIRFPFQSALYAPMHGEAYAGCDDPPGGPL